MASNPIAPEPSRPAAGAPPPSGPTGTAPETVPPSATAEPPRDIAQAPAYRPTPTLKKGARQIFFDFNQAPRDIVRLMDEVRQREQSFRSQRTWRQVIAWLLFPAGLVFLLLDVIIGYNVCTFSLVAVTLWAVAIVALIWLGRQRAAQFDTRYDLTRQMFDVLKDDVAVERTMIGWLDLTGAEQESKIIRQSTSASGQPIVQYQDEWLRLKARLFDGSVLRASLFKRAKVRKGFFKRGAVSGKRKWRAGSSQAVHQLRLAVTANPATYTVRQVSHSGAIPNSRFTFESAELAGNQLQISAATMSDYDAWDVLNTMRFAYDHLQPVG